MKFYFKQNKIFFTVMVLCLSLVSFTAFSQNKALNLAYNYPTEIPVKYLTTSKVIQDMDVNGQSMVVNVLSILGSTIKSTGTDDNNLVLEITIDTLAQTIDAPGSMSGGAVVDVIGKSFTMKITPLGKETDMAAAEQIIYRTDDGATTSVAQSFSDYFPDLPAGAIKPGQTWSSTDTLTSKTSAMSHVMIINAENKFEGYEQYSGTECVKISYSLSGSREMKTQTQGMDINVKGPFTGTGVLYFSAEKGFFLKHEIKTRMNGVIEIVSPENMSFPVIMDMNSTTEVK